MKSIFLSMVMLLSFQVFSQSISYNLDVGKSEVRWAGNYLFSFGEHYGTIQAKEGQIVVEKGQVKSGRIEIDMSTIKNLDQPADDGGKAIEDHLKNEDFFDVSKFPAAVFELLSFKKIEDAKGTQPNYEVTGNFTLKGETHPLTFPAFIEIDDKELSASARFKFDRTKWKVQYGSGKFFGDVGDGAISDAVGIEFKIKAIK